jgi:hypothetical protein
LCVTGTALRWHVLQIIDLVATDQLIIGKKFSGYPYSSIIQRIETMLLVLLAGVMFSYH